MIDIADFLKQYIPEHRGALVTTTGETIGEHSGPNSIPSASAISTPISNFPKTVLPHASHSMLQKKNHKKNIVVVAEGDENPALYKKEIKLTETHFINSIGGRAAKTSGFARVRYRQPVAKRHSSGK